MKSLLLNLASKIDAFTEYTGKCISSLVIILVLLVGYDVSMRYLFNSGSIAIQELEWHLFSIIFLLGSAYTLKHNEHVRLDIFYNSKFMNKTTRAWCDVLGTLLILIPFCLLIIVSAWPFVTQAYIHNETSPDPGGLGRGRRGARGARSPCREPRPHPLWGDSNDRAGRPAHRGAHAAA